MKQALRAGLLAGAAGTCAEAVWAAALQRLRRHAPVYDPARMAPRLVRRYARREIDPLTARMAGTLMRAAYGPSWGAVIALLGRRRHPILANAVAAALAIWLVELVALPCSGATPPLRTWPRGDALLDATNALAFSTVTCALLTVAA